MLADPGLGILTSFLKSMEVVALLVMIYGAIDDLNEGHDRYTFQYQRGASDATKYLSMRSFQILTAVSRGINAASLLISAS